MSKEKQLYWQKYLIKLFDNPLGRWYLGVPSGLKIYKITPIGVHYYTGELSKNPKGFGLPIICTGARSSGQRPIVFQKLRNLANVLSLFVFLPFFPKMLLPLVIGMADTGYKSPTSDSKYYSTGVNPEKAYSSNDDYCTRTIASGSVWWQSWEEFAFGLVGNEEIDGVEVSYEHFSNQTIKVGIQLRWYCDSDGVWSDTEGITPITSEDIQVVGGAASLWGRTPVAADFSDANFSVAVYGSTSGPIVDFSVDHIQVKVYYTPGETTAYATVAGLTTLEIANVRFTFASLATLEKVPVSTFAVFSNLEAPAFVLSTFALIATLEKVPVSTFASLVNLEKAPVSTFASLANLEKEVLSTFAGIATLEEVVTPTFAVLAILKKIGAPVLITPLHQSDVRTPVTFVWEIPIDAEDKNVHAYLQVDKSSDAFGDLEIDISSMQGGFEYWDGNDWVEYPQSGVASAYYGNQARYTTSLTLGNKWWRVRGGAV